MAHLDVLRSATKRLTGYCFCRALDGDVVAVELLPESQWRGASAHLPQADAESTTGGDEEDGADIEGGHIAQVC